MDTKRLTIFLFSALIAIIQLSGLTIDDFSADPDSSPMRGQWRGFTDRVMGGRSDMQAGLIQEDGELFLRMLGTVTTENNGGFIQVRLAFEPSQLNADLQDYEGVRVRYRINREGNYLIHLRTRQSRLPWAYYSASLPDGDGWQIAEIPWSEFKANGTMRQSFNPNDLRSLALVAGEDNFQAEIDLQLIGLYD
jgi:hypothetical protein